MVVPFFHINFLESFNRLTESPVGTPQTVKEVLQNKTLQRLKQATETERARIVFAS